MRKIRTHVKTTERQRRENKDGIGREREQTDLYEGKTKCWREEKVNGRMRTVRRRTLAWGMDG